MTTGITFILRPGSPTDRAFIADSWLNTLRAATEESKHADWDAFRTHHHQRIDTILDNPKVHITVAAPEGDELTIYGYLVEAPPGVVHMVFVKKPFRRQGVAKRLLDGRDMGAVVFTQWSSAMSEWILAKFRRYDGTRDRFGNPRPREGLKYNPYLGAP